MTLHYCNTWFEETLIAKKQTLRSLHYLFQYLPLLYADKNDTILVDAFPKDPIRDFQIKPYEPHFSPLNLWVNEDPLTIRLLSKEFIFHHTTRPQGSQIIYSLKEAEAFEKAFSQQVVFKQFLSFSAIGHARCAKDILRFPCLAEPWLERTLDFSTQWILHENGVEYLGFTHLLVASQGGYRGTEIGTIQIEKKYFDTHMREALELLKYVQELGFRGNVGLDAFVHKDGFQSICEMNPRKTMGFVALMYARRENIPALRLKIGPSPQIPLLPTQLIDRYQTQVRFPKNLFLDKL